MKKIIILFALVLAFEILTGCNSDSDISNQNNSDNNVINIIDNKTVMYDWECKVDVSENEDGTLSVDYFISDLNSGYLSSFSEKPMFNKSWYEMYKGLDGMLYELVDYNFDGYIDIKTQQNGAMVNQYYNIRIWNNELGKFELDQEYMSLLNPYVNTEKKQIFTTSYDRGLGNYRLYEVEDGVLVEIASIEVVSNYDDNSFKYVETVGDSEGKDIVKVEELDSIWDEYKDIIYLLLF